MEAYLAAYARQFLGDDLPVPPLTVRSDRGVFEVSTGTRVLAVGRISAFLSFAGRFWGAVLARPGEPPIPRIPALSSFPTGETYGVGPYDEWYRGLQLRPETRRPLEEVARALPADADGEAVLLLRRVSRLDGQWGDLASAEETARIRAVRRGAEKAALRHTEILGKISTKETWSPLGVAKVAAPCAASADPVERLIAALVLDGVMHELLHSNHLSFEAVVRAPLHAMVGERDGAVYEAALGCCQNLGHKLVHKRAYAEARPYLDAVIAGGVGLSEALRARWECRLYEAGLSGGPPCDDDWARADAVETTPALPTPLYYNARSRIERRAVTLARVTRALVTRAGGGDPCTDRRISKKAVPPTRAQATRMLAFAHALADEALEVLPPYVRPETLPIARHRPAHAEALAARGTVRKARGDVDAAVEDFLAAEGIGRGEGLEGVVDWFARQDR
jgi:hypothetical protein